MVYQFTEQEEAAMKSAANLWNVLLKMEPEHPDDIDDLRYHIHGIQNIIAARVGMRQFNRKFDESQNDYPE
jgi:hypothetical protein